MLVLSEMPVIRLSHLDEAERRTYRIADNKLTELGGWEETRLICGYATEPPVPTRLMDGTQASLMVTSPPYAQQRDYGAAKEKVGD